MDSLQTLTKQEVETALKVVAQTWKGQAPLTIPPVLYKLSMHEWTLLSAALKLLEEEKKEHLLQ